VKPDKPQVEIIIRNVIARFNLSRRRTQNDKSFTDDG
jgi:hypothetical protein